MKTGMEPGEITYAELKFPLPLTQAAKKEPECKQPQQKISTSKLLVALLVITSFLLLVALIFLSIMYSQTSKVDKTEESFQDLVSRNQQLSKEYEVLQSNYSHLMKCAMCKNVSCVTSFDATTFTCKQCPDGWLLNEGQCYYFSKETLSWEASRNRCLAAQADLLIFGDTDEQFFINKHNCGTYWMGLTDREDEGKWKWVNGSVLSFKEFWKPEQPDDFEKAEDCATIGWLNSECRANLPLKNWNDDNCNKTHKYICEKEAETSMLRRF